MIPLDATFPENRLSFILSDASAAAVVTTAKFRSKVESMCLDIPVVYVSVEELEAHPVSFDPTPDQIGAGDDEAYVVYTSGSTGRPKGVPVLHKGVVNTIEFSSSMCYEGARVAQFMAIGFDGCQWDTWSALILGVSPGFAWVRCSTTVWKPSIRFFARLRHYLSLVTLQASQL